MEQTQQRLTREIVGLFHNYNKNHCTSFDVTCLFINLLSSNEKISMANSEFINDARYFFITIDLFKIIADNPILFNNLSCIKK